MCGADKQSSYHQQNRHSTSRQLNVWGRQTKFISPAEQTLNFQIAQCVGQTNKVHITSRTDTQLLGSSMCGADKQSSTSRQLNVWGRQTKFISPAEQTLNFEVAQCVGQTNKVHITSRTDTQLRGSSMCGADKQSSYHQQNRHSTSRQLNVWGRQTKFISPAEQTLNFQVAQCVGQTNKVHITSRTDTQLPGISTSNTQTFSLQNGFNTKWLPFFPNNKKVMLNTTIVFGLVA